MEKTYWVYVLSSRSRVLYVGVTSRLVVRIKEHRESDNLSFTKKYRIHRLVYFETYRNVKSAIATEKQIKSFTRAKKIALIESRNPNWNDLADGYFAPYPQKQIPRFARDDR
jgi:putative endonuclease